MNGLLFFTSDWSLASGVNKTRGDFHYKVDSILFFFKCDRGCFSQMGDVLSTSLRVSKLQKLEKGSILQVHSGVHLLLKVAPPPRTDLYMLFTVNERSLRVWQKTKGIMGIYKQNGRLVVEEYFVPDFIRFCHH